MARRILLYSHDTVGLGHIRRVLAIGQKLATSHPEDTILILTGSSIVDSVRLPRNVDTIKLPALRKIDNAHYAPRHLLMERDRLIALRSRIIRETFEHFHPHIFVVDKAPVGVHGELCEALEWQRRESPDCQVVLSLRDILDDPSEVIRSWAREGIVAAIREHYDKILVWGEREIYDVAEKYRFPADLAEKIEYCGYIASEVAEPSAPSKADPGKAIRLAVERGNGTPESAPNGSSASGAGENGSAANGFIRVRPTPAVPAARKKLVVATVGGGEDGFFLLDQFVRSLAFTSDRFASVILMGPHLSREHKAKLRARIARVAKPVFAVDFSRHVERLLSAADLVVSMAGYNTVCEIVSRGRRSIVVPRTKPRREQLRRAERFDALGHLRMIHPDELTPRGLAHAIDEELRAGPRRPARPLDFGGLDRAVRILDGGFDGTPLPRQQGGVPG